ncbi:hypothetical protein [Clostridium perfringens]|uniref:hypothetical protein n=1 Tax=Clostridium perfringens TaxID=1502 RepID=UPI0018E45F0C|nr:hypothetical protein [Clostridium perfringens]
MGDLEKLYILEILYKAVINKVGENPIKGMDIMLMQKSITLLHRECLFVRIVENTIAEPVKKPAW